MRAFALLLLSLNSYAEDLIDLERDFRSGFVLDSKRIVIPGFEHAYNPSLLSWEQGFLLSFRTGDQAACAPDLIAQSFWEDCKRSDAPHQSCTAKWQAFARAFKCKNQIGLVFLDKDLNVVDAPQLLYIHYPRPLVAERQHDPRLVRVGQRVFLVYSNMITGHKKPEIRRPFVAELYHENGIFFSSAPMPIVRYEGVDSKVWSKNWVPFDYLSELYLSHHINPHIVFKFDGTIACTTVSKSERCIAWNLGELRGGTPAVLDDDGQYLAIFHSMTEMKTTHSDGMLMPHYFMGAYTFKSVPPFSLTSISNTPIVGPGFYDGPAYRTWRPLRVVFPGGLVIDGNVLLVAYGRQDHEIWIATVDKMRLKQSLMPL